ncbi:MAG: ribonuclease PH [Rickettsiales bacterium]|jgi:ribonuclease PH|nr:ribonuclease PH [Rickettsiales bacterium]
MRAFLRAADALRKAEILTGVNKHAEGSCLVKFGDTQVLCTATVENKVPPFLRGLGRGWVTAEYSMLPRATGTRNDRDSMKLHPNGRTTEISRLVGRSLRAAVNLGAFGERQVIVDCDVLQADGGTRTAAITGGFVAMHLAFQKLADKEKSVRFPVLSFVSAVSAGIVGDERLLDLDFAEDGNAKTDANFVITGDGRIVEVQAAAEKVPFTDEDLSALLALAKKGAAELDAIQRRALGI